MRLYIVEYTDRENLPPLPAGEWWPSTARVYRSRSGALDRAKLIRSLGGECDVLETETSWLTLEDAKAQREQRRKRAKIARLYDEIARVRQS